MFSVPMPNDEQRGSAALNLTDIYGVTTLAGAMNAESVPLWGSTIIVPCPFVDLEKKASVLTVDDW
jgi:hypothetical protein